MDVRPDTPNTWDWSEGFVWVNCDIWPSGSHDSGVLWVMCTQIVILDSDHLWLQTNNVKHQNGCGCWTEPPLPLPPRTAAVGSELLSEPSPRSLDVFLPSKAPQATLTTPGALLPFNCGEELENMQLQWQMVWSTLSWEKANYLSSI